MTDIYRFMTLTELHHLLNCNVLKFARLSTMDDPNEGLGHVLGLLESFSFSFNITGQEKIKEYHDHVRGCNYIRSWTLKPDLMSMWLLYSKNHDSIRVKTKLDKLESATKEYFDEHFSFRQLDSPEGTLQLDSFPYVKPVQYVSFESLSEDIKTKYERYLDACDKLAEAEAEGDKSGGGTFHEKLRKLDEDRSISLVESFYLKDLCYSHEKEIRANISICTRNNVKKDEFEEQQKQKTMRFIMGSILNHHPPSSELPDVIHIPTPQDFIEAVCFDPHQ